MTGDERQLRVLVVTPTGRDGPMICSLLSSKDMICDNLPTAETARTQIKLGAGVIILAEEALTLPDVGQWTKELLAQPSWSDLPIILLTVAGAVDHENQRKVLFRQPLGNLILLERPVRPETFISTVQAALRSRSRQYQVRDYLFENLRTEEALRTAEKLAIAGRLAASIAHEINNPLESVVNLLYLVGSSSCLEESKCYAQTAMDELARVSEIVTQTLRFHREPNKPVMVQVSEIVDSALVLYQARLTSARIVIEKDFRESQPVLARSGELRQLIANLVGNALDAMAGGGTLKIRISNTREHTNGSRPGIRLTVADTGPGIPLAIKQRLFEPFVSTKGNNGTGLGLWVSSGIVRNHGGTIQVKSSALPPVTGTVFSIFLPLHSEPASTSGLAATA